MQDPTRARPPRPSTASPPAEAVAPADTLHDQRAVQILATEHWGLLSERSLAYNESFTRTGMFLAFLSMSFVALALLAQAIGFSGEYLVIAALAIAVNIFIGLATYARVMTTWLIDGRAIQGMNRIRHGYVEIAPAVGPYFITGTHDDMAGVDKTYGIEGVTGTSRVAGLVYGLSTVLGMVAVIVALLAGVLVGLLASALGGALWAALGVALLAAIVVFTMQLAWAGKVLSRTPVIARFPTPAAATDEV